MRVGGIGLHRTLSESATTDDESKIPLHSLLSSPRRYSKRLQCDDYYRRIINCGLSCNHGQYATYSLATTSGILDQNKKLKNKDREREEMLFL